MSEEFKQLSFGFTEGYKTPEELEEERLVEGQREALKKVQEIQIDDESEPIEDPQLKKYLSNIEDNRGFNVFSRKTNDGLHIYGVEKVLRTPNDPPKILILMGMGMPAELAIKIVSKYGSRGRDVIAISRPGLGQSRPVLCFDEEEGREVEKPIEEWVMADALIPYSEFIKEDGGKFVLVGFSQGGLHAALLGCKEKLGVKDHIVGCCGIAPVKTSNVCVRNEDIDVTDDFPKHKPREGESPLVFRAIDNPDWPINNLYTGSKGVPRNINWTISVLNKGVASYNEVNDYRGDNGKISVEEWDLPWLEICGTKDSEETCGIYQELPKERTKEYLEQERKRFLKEEEDIIMKLEELGHGPDPADEEARIEKDERKIKLEKERLRINREFRKKSRQIIIEDRMEIHKTLKAKLMKEADEETQKAKEKDKKGHRPIPIYENMKRPSMGLWYANEKEKAHEKIVRRQLISRSEQLKDPKRSRKLRPPLVSNIAKLTRPNFKHVKLEGASHGDPISKEEYVDIVVEELDKAIQSGFFNRKTKQKPNERMKGLKINTRSTTALKHNLIYTEKVNMTHLKNTRNSNESKESDSPEATDGTSDDEE